MVKARMDKAADLLADGELNVSEVSYKVGIQDPSYFNKLFKSYYGVLPSKYVRDPLFQQPQAIYINLTNKTKCILTSFLTRIWSSDDQALVTA